MIKKVIILGLYNQENLALADRDYLLKKAGFEQAEIWTLNDWYQFYPNFQNPDRVFQIHKGFKGHSDPARFAGDWKQKYNDSGAEIITSEYIPELVNQKQINEAELVKSFGKDFFTSTIDVMLAFCILEEAHNVRLFGISMTLNGEYEYQLMGLLNAMEIAELYNIKIEAEQKEFWISQRKKIDWKNMKSHCVLPYWLNKKNRGEILV